MNDESRPTATEPIAPIDASLAGPLGAAARPEGAPALDHPAAAFSGRTPRKSDAVRAGMILGTALVVAAGAAVALGASPNPASPAPAGGTPTVPGHGNGPGAGGPSTGGFGPFGAFGPGGVGPGGFGPGGFGPGGRFGAGGPGGLGGPGATAVDPGFLPARGFGAVSVTAVSGSTVTLSTEDGWTRVITVTAATTITKGGAAARLADLKVGDAVRISETRNADGTWTITAIGIVLPQVSGTVTAVGADSISITLRDGTTQAIRTTGSTAYRVEEADGQRSDVTVGAAIIATGERASDGSLTASTVWVQLPRVLGTVTATTADTITLKKADGTALTVHVGAGVTIRVAGIASAKLSDVSAGMIVAVEGTQRADGSLDARAIDAGGPGRGRGGVAPRGPAASPAPAGSGGTTG
jgi:hypothetical protein